MAISIEMTAWHNNQSAAQAAAKISKIKAGEKHQQRK